MGKSLGLDIPDRQKPGKQSFSIRARNVEAWLDNLPKANLGETARQVYLALTETNRLHLPHQDRARFLESLRETVQYVTESMRKHFLGVTYPLPEKNQKIAAATRGIYTAMATGYKIAIEDMASRPGLFFDKKHMALLLQRAIGYSGRSLLTAYQVYAPYPAGVWGELHKMYAYAESHRLHRHAVSDFTHLFVEKSSVADEYLRNLLTWLATPYRLRQGEVTKIYNTLERWVRYCELRLPEQPDEPGRDGQFVVLLSHDQPPTAFLKSRLRCGRDCRMLDTTRLIARLRRDIQESEDVVSTTLTGIDMGRPDLSHDLLRRLLVAWGVESQRTFPRSERREAVQVAVGLTSIHEHLRHQHHDRLEDAAFDHPAEYRAETVEAEGEEKPDVWDMVYPHGTDLHLTRIVNEELSLAEQLAGHTATARKPGPAGAHHSELPPLTQWRITNESANGFCLEYDKGDGTRSQVGELVGIRRRLSAHAWKWNIGVIRWMKFNSQRILQLGVELLNPDAAAIGMRSLAAAGKDPAYQRTLLLPENPAIGQPASLITGPVPWREGNKLVLNILGREVKVALTRQLQNTGLFAQFEFAYLDSARATAENRSESPEESEFGQIWSAI